MQYHYQTERLQLYPLTPADAAFILELVNTPGWIKFIGDRKIANLDDATAYVNKIMKKPNITYWTVKLKSAQMPVGIITIIKRDYLPHHDIGFAFLPQHGQQGYAFEAATEVLNQAVRERALKYMLATTLKDNEGSIRLLKKLGFSLWKEMKVEQECLLVYRLATG